MKLLVNSADHVQSAPHEQSGWDFHFVLDKGSILLNTIEKYSRTHAISKLKSAFALTKSYQSIHS